MAVLYACRVKSMPAKALTSNKRLVRGNVLRLEGLKRAEAHVQSYEGPGDTPLPQTFKDLRREVQAGGRRGHGACLACIDRLVTFAVGGRRAAFADIRRQRHLAMTV